jgi:hypothetical protein
MLLAQLKKRYPQTYEALPEDAEQYAPDQEAHSEQPPNDLDVLMVHCLRYDLGPIYRA